MGYVFACFCVAFIFYFLYHTLTGRYSLVNMLQMKMEIAKGETTLKQLTDKRQYLEFQVSHIDKNIDVDLLEEEARKNGLVAPGEIVMPRLAMPNRNE